MNKNKNKNVVDCIGRPGSDAGWDARFLCRVVLIRTALFGLAGVVFDRLQPVGGCFADRLLMEVGGGGGGGAGAGAGAGAVLLLLLLLCCCFGRLQLQK